MSIFVTLFILLVFCVSFEFGTGATFFPPVVNNKQADRDHDDQVRPQTTPAAQQYRLQNLLITADNPMNHNESRYHLRRIVENRQCEEIASKEHTLYVPLAPAASGVPTQSYDRS